MDSNGDREAWRQRVQSRHNDVEVLCEAKAELSRGIFFNENPLDDPFNLFMFQLIFMGLAYLLVCFLLRPFKQPKFVCSVLAGILISPGVLGAPSIFGKSYVNAPLEVFQTRTLANLGIAYFIFIIAVKMDVGMIRRTAKDATLIGVSSVVAPFLTVLMLCLQSFLLPERDDKKRFDLFPYLFSAGLSVTRFPNVAHAFDELNLLTSELGQLVLSCTMISELATWTSLITGVYYRTADAQGWYVLATAALFVLFAVFIIHPVMKWIVRNTPEGQPVRNAYVMAIIVGALVLSLITDMMGSLHLGVLVLGLVIPEGPPLGSEIVRKTELIVMEFLMPLFYISIGYNIKFGIFTKPCLKKTSPVILAAMVSKFLAAALPALYCGVGRKHAFLVGLMMNIKGPLDLYLFNRWSNKGEIQEALYVTLVLSNVTLTGIVTPLIDVFYNSSDRLNNTIGASRRAIQTIPRSMDLRILSCIHREENVLGTLCLLEASNATETSPICAFLVQLEELVGRATPVVIPHKKSLTRTKSKKSYSIMRAVGRYLKNSLGFAKVKVYSVIAPYKSIHENIYTLAVKEKVSLVIVPFHQDQEFDYAKSAAVRKVNNNITQWAPCSVGILVDKGMHMRCMKADDHFTCNVAVVFTGGPDDREALTLGARMSRHPDIHMTVLYFKKINRTWDEVESFIEKKLDDALVDEFKMSVMGNRRIEFRQVNVDDGETIINAVRSLEDEYDLVIVGRESEVTKDDFNQLMLTVWNENPELGILGELIASKDFHGGLTSVLVMQNGSHGRDLPQFIPDNMCTEDQEYLLRR